MTMKREFAIAGLALVVSILLSSPSIAQAAPPPAEPAATPATSTATAMTDAPSLEEISLDDAILLATSPEDRKRLLMRCAGPPPRPAQDLADITPSQPAG
jgi:hypothetical protein